MRETTKTKWIFTFGDGKADGTAKMRKLLGGKGANLAEMAGLGLPVPPGFTITTEVCTYFTNNGYKYPEDLEPGVDFAMAFFEGQGLVNGDAQVTRDHIDAAR